MTPSPTQLPYTCDKLPDGRWLIRVDPSSITNSNCLREFELNNLTGLTPKKTDHVMTYGSAVHETVAALLNKSKPTAAINLGLDFYNRSDPDYGLDWLNPGHLIKTLDSYCRKYTNDSFSALESGGVRCVEQSFMIDLFETSIAKFVLVGKMDAIGKMSGSDVVYIKDVKCTRAHDPTKFFVKYLYHTQMKLYAYVVQKLGITNYLPPVIIDGVFLINESKCCVLERSFAIDFTEAMVNDSVQWVMYQCEKINHALATTDKSAMFIKNDSACFRFGRNCEFVKLCWGRPGEAMLDAQRFTQRKYDPNTFGKFE